MTSAVSTPPDTSTITIHRARGTVTIRPAPPREPPFDDELDPDRIVHRSYDRPLPFLVPPRRRALIPIVPTGRRAALPDPAQWGRRLLIGIVETAAGRRPLAQLTALLSPSVAAGLRDEFEYATKTGRPHWTRAASVRTVRSSSPADEVAELSATVQVGSRVRAVAMRVEVRHHRWCCTRLVLG